MPLTDASFDVVVALAWPLPADQRDHFFVAVEDAMRSWPEAAHGPGLAYRVACQLQRKLPRPAAGYGAAAALA